MPMMVSKLSAMFAGPPVATEQEAIDYISTKWVEFFADTSVIGVPANISALAPIKATFSASLVGMAQAGQGAAKLQQAMTAFWLAAIAVAPTIWATVPVIIPGSGTPPPGLSTMAASMAPVFAANASGSRSVEDSSNALGSAILAAQSGATVTLGPPPIGGTPLVPIL